jgi:hypothetical protein
LTISENPLIALSAVVAVRSSWSYFARKGKPISPCRGFGFQLCVLQAFVRTATGGARMRGPDEEPDKQHTEIAAPTAQSDHRFRSRLSRFGCRIVRQKTIGIEGGDHAGFAQRLDMCVSVPDLLCPISTADTASAARY